MICLVHGHLGLHVGDTSSALAAEAALEGERAGAMPNWRRMAMLMRGPSPSSVAALAALCARTIACMRARAGE